MPDMKACYDSLSYLNAFIYASSDIITRLKSNILIKLLEIMCLGRSVQIKCKNWLSLIMVTPIYFFINKKYELCYNLN